MIKHGMQKKKEGGIRSCLLLSKVTMSCKEIDLEACLVFGMCFTSWFYNDRD